MKSLFYPFLILMCLTIPIVVAEEVMKEVSAPQTENVLSSEITLIAEQESVKAEDGGYLANPSVVDCFAEMSYQYTGGRYENETIKFRFHSPDKVVPDKKYPLIIWLHGVGESGNDNQRQLAHMQSTMEFLAGPHKLDCYILATQCPEDNRTWDHSMSSEGKGDAPLTILMEILEQVLTKFPVDRNRVSIVGICSGGYGTWPLLKAKPNFFSATAVFAATPSIGLAWHEHCKGTKLWAFNNRDDGGVPIEPMRQFVAMVNQSGERAYLTERNGGHDAHTLAMRQDKIVAWLIEQDRSKTSPPPGLAVYSYNNKWEPFFWFALPVLLSLSLALVQIKRRLRQYKITGKN